MKKIILTGFVSLLSLLFINTCTYAQNANGNINAKPNQQVKKLPPQMDKPTIDDRLNLTEDQKMQAHTLRMQGHEQIKPVFEKIKDTKQKIAKVKASDLKQEDKDALITTLNEELKTLILEAKQIRIENTKAFEAILDDTQKSEFEKIKKEGRERSKQQKQNARTYPAKKK